MYAKPVRLVLDTNTVVSGLLWENAPFQLIQTALRGRVDLCTSRTLLLELEDVLPRRKFANRVAITKLDAAHLLNLKSYQRIAIVTAAAALAQVGG